MTTAERLDTTGLARMPSVEVDPNAATEELCRAWASSIYSGIALEPTATRALFAIVEREGRAIERLCSPYTPATTEVATTEASTNPETVGPPLPPTGSTVSTTVGPAAVAAVPSATKHTSHPPNTLPPQAQGNGPTVTEPTRGDHTSGPSSNGNAGANANANGNGNGDRNNNPNANNGANGTGDADNNPNANNNAANGKGNPNG